MSQDDRRELPFIFFSEDFEETDLPVWKFGDEDFSAIWRQKTKKRGGKKGTSQSSKKVVTEETVRPMEAYIKETDELIAKLWEDIKEREKNEDK